MWSVSGCLSHLALEVAGIGMMNDSISSSWEGSVDRVHKYITTKFISLILLKCLTNKYKKKKKKCLTNKGGYKLDYLFVVLTSCNVCFYI